jgi:hypothetical protein
MLAVMYIIVGIPYFYVVLCYRACNVTWYVINIAGKKENTFTPYGVIAAMTIHTLDLLTITGTRVPIHCPYELMR